MEKYNKTMYICQLPKEKQCIIKNLLEKVEGVDIETAMNGRICDIEDVIDLKKLVI